MANLARQAPQKTRRHSGQQIVQKLDQGLVHQVVTGSYAEAAARLGVSARTFRRWRQNFAGCGPDQAAHIDDLKREIEEARRVARSLECART